MTAISVGPPVPVVPGVTFRRYRGLEDVEAMAAANGRLRQAIGVMEPVDADAMRHRYADLVNSDATTDCLIAEIDGVVVGYGRAEWHDLNDGDRSYISAIFIAPAGWGRGAYAAVLDWTEARFGEMAVEHPSNATAWLVTEAFDGDVEALGATAALGYEAVRRYAEMVRPDLDDLPEVQLAEGYAFREVGRDDLRAIWDLNVAAFSDSWGEWDEGERGFENWATDPRHDPALFVVAYRGDKPASIVLNILEQGPDGHPRGLLGGVATHPDHRRRGLARSCIARSLRLLRDAGARSAYLSVDTQNPRQALTLYESCGFRVASGSVGLRRPFEPGVPSR
jgi:ribosomal protein S18 acetylase RimI-like enzyme